MRKIIGHEKTKAFGGKEQRTRAVVEYTCDVCKVEKINSRGTGLNELRFMEKLRGEHWIMGDYQTCPGCARGRFLTRERELRVLKEFVMRVMVNGQCTELSVGRGDYMTLQTIAQYTDGSESVIAARDLAIGNQGGIMLASEYKR